MVRRGNPDDGVRVRLESLGCRLNQAEVDSLARQLAALGHRLVGAGEEADVCLLNTCTVTATASRKSRHLLRRLRRENPQATVVATGCFSELEGAATRAAGVDLVIPNASKDRMLESLIAADLLCGRPCAVAAPPPEVPVSPTRRRTRAFVKVQDGCDNRCTYCIVTIARGEGRSRAAAEVVAEIDRLERAGCPEAVLTGVHLGSYGHDRGDGKGLQGLVRAILAETAIPRLRLSSLEPWDLEDAFFALFDEPRLLPHLHLPLQSGSDEILRRMGRAVTRAGFSRLVETARAAIPDLAVSTDIMVGFPGETEEHFLNTVSLIERLAFSRVHVFRFSPRPGTAAATFPDQVAADRAVERSRRMLELAGRLERQFMMHFVGRTMDVLWESLGHGKLSGLTPNYLRVLANPPEGHDLRGLVTPTVLEAVEAGALRGAPLPPQGA